MWWWPAVPPKRDGDAVGDGKKKAVKVGNKSGVTEAREASMDATVTAMEPVEGTTEAAGGNGNHSKS